MKPTISQIQVSFPVPVDLTAEDRKELVDLVTRIIKRHEPPGHVYWVFGYGSLPLWSQTDAAFLGLPVHSNAPLSGEPKFDDSVFSITTRCRER